MARPNPAARQQTDTAPALRTRRDVLRAMSASGALAAVLLAGPANAAGVPLLRISFGKRFVYRFTTRGQRACKACRLHHRYVVGATEKELERSRAHPGCNCRILTQVVTATEFARMFPAGHGVIDLRRG
jgi:hypothetical protein